MTPSIRSAALGGLSATPQERAQIRTDLGLDEPVYVQLVKWYAGLARGDEDRAEVDEHRGGAGVDPAGTDSDRVEAECHPPVSAATEPGHHPVPLRVRPAAGLPPGRGL